MVDPQVVVEVVGEGKTDIGVVPVFVHKICSQPTAMQFKTKRVADLQQRGGLNRKVRFAKLQATLSGRHALVFVVDTEGEAPKKIMAELNSGRDSSHPELPTAVGVAHPCIESWLLADAAAIGKALKLTISPVTPEDPEALKAPRKDRDENPKTILGKCAGVKGTVSTVQANAIALCIDLSRIETICPKSFKPFADEVRANILPLFAPSQDPPP